MARVGRGLVMPSCRGAWESLRWSGSTLTISKESPRRGAAKCRSTVLGRPMIAVALATQLSSVAAAHDGCGRLGVMMNEPVSQVLTEP